MATKDNPGAFDCYENAAPDEPMFVLLARDISAPETVRRWATLRVLLGKNQPDDAQIVEAMECANAMEEYACKGAQA